VTQPLCLTSPSTVRLVTLPAERDLYVCNGNDCVSVNAMSHQNRDLLDILRFELKFLEDGGYTSSSHAPWRASYIFEDSPSCLNFKQSTRPHPCSECLLTRLVPPELREHEVPCRFIPLDDKGHTVDSLYRTGTHDEIVATLKNWLRQEIRKLEDELRKGEHK
jgi:hypothetical protein